MALVIIILAVYMKAGNHQFLDFDDRDYVTNNSHVASGITYDNIIWAFTSVDKSNWHPITWLSHMADVQLYGMNPRGHHLTNVVIHTASSVLLLLLLFRLTGALWQSSFVAFLFALHPLHVESVAWVAERKDVLSAFFWFFTLLLYAAYVARPKPALYLFALFSFVLGLMSKPMLVTLPVVMLLIDFWPLHRWQHEKLRPISGRALAIIKEKIPFFACSILSSIITIYAQYHGGAMSSLDEMPYQVRVENALISYVKYIGKTLWPHDLAVFYPPSAFSLWQVINSLLFLSIVTTIVIRAMRRYPYLLVGWFWFLVTLVPVIGLIQVGGQSMADRYSYIPVIGLFIMVAWGIPDLTVGMKHRQSILSMLAGVVIIVFSAQTWRQLGYWHDNISLFRHTIQVTTDNYIIHNNLGGALAENGDLDAAILEYQEALRINPNDVKTHNNLGIALGKKGAFDAAIKEFQASLRINPTDGEIHNNLGFTLFNKGSMDAAIHEYQEALRLNPNDTKAYYNLEMAQAKMKIQNEGR